MYEETTGEQGIRGDSSCDDEEEQKEPPPEPTQFGWVQGVMVGKIRLQSCCTSLNSPNYPNQKCVPFIFL